MPVVQNQEGTCNALQPVRWSIVAAVGQMFPNLPVHQLREAWPRLLPSNSQAVRRTTCQTPEPVLLCSGRPTNAAAVEHEANSYLKFSAKVRQKMNEVCGFVSTTPEAVAGTRITDFCKVHALRRKCRQEFIAQKIRQLEGEQFAPGWFTDWFGVDGATTVEAGTDKKLVCAFLQAS